MSLNDIGKQIRQENTAKEYLKHCQKNGKDFTNYESTITLPKQRRQ